MKFEWNTTLLLQENLFENVVCIMAAILYRPQCVNTDTAQVHAWMMTNVK